MGVITGRLIGTAGPTALAVPSVGQIVENVVALRALTGSADLPAVTLAQYQSAAPGVGGGVFVWDAVAGTDDGVTRFNAGGEESSGEGWRRVYSGPIYSSWGGAVGDGSTPDAVALQRVLNASVGAECVIEPGTYVCAVGLTVGAGTTVRGTATLDWSGAGHVTGLTLGSACVVDGLELIGAGAGTYNDNGRALAVSGTDNSPAAPTYAIGPQIRKCRLTAWAGYGVRAEFCTALLVCDTTILDIGAAGVIGLSCDNAHVEACSITNVGWAGAADAYGVAWTRQSTASETSHPRSNYCTVTGCVVSGMEVVANSQGLNTHGGIACVFSANIIQSVNVGIAVVAAELGASYQLAPQRAQVLGNVIAGVNANTGIIITGASDDAGATINAYNVGSVVAHNHVAAAGEQENDNDGAIRAYGTKSLSVTGNVIEQPACNGVVFAHHNHGFIVSGNTITDPFADTTTGMCVRINGDDNSGAIVGNVFRFADSGLGTNVANYGVWCYVGASGLALLIRDNARLRDSDTRLQITTNGAAGVLAAQQFEGAGSPEGVVTGNVGDEYHRTDGGAGTTLYVKESGAATNTGWVAYGAIGLGLLAPGSESYSSDQWHIQYRRLQLTSTQRLTLAGTARYIITDL